VHWVGWLLRSYWRISWFLIRKVQNNYDLRVWNGVWKATLTQWLYSPNKGRCLIIKFIFDSSCVSSACEGECHWLSLNSTSPSLTSAIFIISGELCLPCVMLRVSLLVKLPYTFPSWSLVGRHPSPIYNYNKTSIAHYCQIVWNWSNTVMCVNILLSLPKYSGIYMTIVWIFFRDRNIDAILFWIWKIMRSYLSAFWKKSDTCISILWRLSAYTYLDLKRNYKGSIPGLHKSQLHGHPCD